MASVSATSSSRRALVLFTSHPGKEAFRKHLADGIQQVQAIYRVFLGHILGIAAEVQQRLDFDVLIASESADIPNLNKVYASLPTDKPYQFIEHVGSHFDTKLKYALSQTFGKGYDQVVVIGNDCLDLTADILGKAFEALANGEIVLGPAEDGGFYLLGMNHYNAALFEDVNWCSASVFKQICQNIVDLEKRLSLLPCLGDIDTDHDLRHWLCSLPVDGSRSLSALLRNILRHEVVPVFYCSPFLPKFHLKKRNWQKPPPSPFNHPVL